MDADESKVLLNIKSMESETRATKKQAASMTIAVKVHRGQVCGPDVSNQSLKAPSRNRNPSIKKVSFLSYVTTYLDTSQIYEVEDRWYNANDYSRFRSQLVHDSNNFTALNPQSVRALRKIMKACQKADAEECLHKEEDLSHLLEPRLENILHKCLQDAPELIGMHIHCVAYLLQDKKNRRSKMIEVVMQTQTPPRSPIGSGMVPNGICQGISRPSRLFAQVIGHVAAKAA